MTSQKILQLKLINNSDESKKEVTTKIDDNLSQYSDLPNSSSKIFECLTNLYLHFFYFTVVAITLIND